MSILLRRRMMIGIPSSGPPPVVPEALAFVPATPTVTDQNDNPVNLGLRFAVTTPGTWVGCRIRIPDTPPTAPIATAYNADTSTLLTQQAFVPVAGGYQDVLFTTPQAIVSGVTYMAAWFTDQYAFTAVYTWPALSPSTKIFTDSNPVDTTRFTYNAGVALPTTSSVINFYVGPLVTFP